MSFWEFLQSPIARLVMAGTALAAIVLIAWWYVKGLRREMQDEGPSAHELLDQFRDLRDRGELSPEEYKKIKSRLGDQLREELDAELATRDAQDVADETSPRPSLATPVPPADPDASRIEKN